MAPTTEHAGRARRAVVSQAVTLPGQAGDLEAVLEHSDDPPVAIALVCHPHPLQHGTMRNKVVHTLARSFCRLGAQSLRFNFRGVGASAGKHDDGEGEVDDALAAAGWLAERFPGLPLLVGGFSFGANVALRAAAKLAPAGLVTVAPPVARLPAGFVPARVRWLLIQSRDDEVVPAADVEQWVGGLAVPPAVELFDGAGHFFHGCLPALAGAVERFFAATVETRRRS